MDITYLTLEQIALIHELQIEFYGGGSGVRDIPLLESALYRPQIMFDGEDMYKSVFEKAAVLMHSIILNHPFVDGNKRTGAHAALTFLEINGHSLEIEDEELVGIAIKIAIKKVDQKELAKWLRENSRRL